MQIGEIERVRIGEGGHKPSDAENSARAGLLVRYALGCLHQYSKSGVTKKPTENLAGQRRYVSAQWRGLFAGGPLYDTVPPAWRLPAYRFIGD